MKSLSLLTTAAMGAAAFAACAAPAAAQPPASGEVDWSGPYVGANVGWSGSNSQALAGGATTNQVTGANGGAGAVTVPPVSFPTAQMDYGASSWAAGGQAGFNHQMGHLVLGFEGDMDAVGGRASQFSSYALPATGLTTGGAVSIDRFTDPGWTASVRGRVGWATGKLLLYGTGGLALADVRQGAAYAYAPTPTAAAAGANPAGTFGPFANASASEDTLTGWTVGGGAEWRLSPAISLGAEYRHSDYGQPGYSLGANAPNATFENPKIGFTDDQVLAKINFHFGPGVF